MRTRHHVDNLRWHLNASKLSILPPIFMYSNYLYAHRMEMMVFDGFLFALFHVCVYSRIMEMFKRFNGKLLHRNTDYYVISAQLFYRCTILCTVRYEKSSSSIISSISSGGGGINIDKDIERKRGFMKKNSASKMPIPYENQLVFHFSHRNLFIHLL